MHEASLHDENCFITLTYDDEHLPENGSLCYSHFQLFMKRLRKKFTGKRISFYMCGEYGDTTSRPHYHAILFNHTFPDLEYLKKTGSDAKIYTSEILSKLWPYGMSSIGSVTFESAGYVARYCLKKVTGDDSRYHYSVLDRETGELTPLVPPFSHMSLRPGIARDFFVRFRDDCFPSDIVVVNGRKVNPPKYYDRLYKRMNPDGFRDVKDMRCYISKYAFWSRKKVPGCRGQREPLASERSGVAVVAGFFETTQESAVLL
ncbi:MAG: hypothetical protein LBJ76_00670 [Candidatus Accumulibacter sp.]|nr:hypothetical protein [Accumulibacter sp.]